MKKWLSLLLVLCMMFMLVACGVPSSDPSNDEDDPKSSASSKDDEDEDKDEENKDDEEKDDENKDDENKDDEASDPSDFEELTVVDNEHCLIKITGMEEDPIWGYSINVYTENKSADKTYTFSVNDMTINDVKVSSLFVEEVAAGKKANSSIRLFASELEEINIGDYTDIMIQFEASDSESWETVTTVSAHVYPYGKAASATYTRESQPTDTVLVDNEFVTVVAIGTEVDEFWGYTVKVFVVNKTDKDIMLSVDEASVNGFMIDPFYASSLVSGACMFDDISWGFEDFENNGITDVEEMEFTISVSDANDWFAGDMVNETVIYNP